jgi:hypothetical protein
MVIGKHLERPSRVGHSKHMFSAMDLIPWCIDISNVVRPFKLANKRRRILCEEFFGQEELESMGRMIGRTRLGEPKP